MKIADWLREQGREQGQAALLLRQLKCKFWELASEYELQVQTANCDQLLLWGEKLLMADRPEILFGK